MELPERRILRIAHAEDSTPGDRHLLPDPLQILFNFHDGLAGGAGPPRHRNIQTCRSRRTPVLRPAVSARRRCGASPCLRFIVPEGQPQYDASANEATEHGTKGDYVSTP